MIVPFTIQVIDAHQANEQTVETIVESVRQRVEAKKIYLLST